MRFFLILSLLIIPFVFSLEVDYSCPERVLEKEGFNCKIEIIDGDGAYDVKFEVKQNDKTISRYWNEEEDAWKSGFYYFNSAIESGEEKEFVFMIEEAGNFKPLLKIRKESKIESFELSISVEKNEALEDEEDIEEKTLDSRKSNKYPEEKKDSQIFKEDIEEESLSETQEISLISLNSVKESSLSSIENEPILSKDILLKAIGVFVIIILGFLLWEKI